jgi:hypothetical protein
MIFDGELLYHPHWPLTIELVDPDSGAIVQTFAQTDVVGITFVDDENGDDDTRQIWITKWGARQVGTWDPNTNTFTPRFMTPELAGGLAWDSRNRILWVGLFGGQVVPYRLDGTPLNAGFAPFGPLPLNTIDGLEFVHDLGHDDDSDDDDDN